MTREPYPSDVTDDERAFGAPYLMLIKEEAPQRDHELRAAFQQAQRWITAGIFEDIVHDLRALLRRAKGKKEQPSAVILDGRTVQSTPKSVDRTGYNGYNRKKDSKIHIAVDTFCESS